MHKVDAPNHSGNEFTDGDPSLGILATILWSKWLNTVQREIVAVVEGAGLSLDDAIDDQLLEAITSMQNAHSSLKTNPHSITAQQIGLGDASNVPASNRVSGSDGTVVGAANGLSLQGIPVDTYRSVGPQGSGAQVEWNALNLVPADAHWVEIRVITSMSVVATGNYSLSVHARKNGSGNALGNDSMIYLVKNSCPAGGVVGGTIIHPVGINDRILDFAWRSINGSNVAITLYLVGYGFNEV